jgi:hypothetical protein
MTKPWASPRPSKFSNSSETDSRKQSYNLRLIRPQGSDAFIPFVRSRPSMTSAMIPRRGCGTPRQLHRARHDEHYTANSRHCVYVRDLCRHTSINPSPCAHELVRARARFPIREASELTDEQRTGDGASSTGPHMLCIGPAWLSVTSTERATSRTATSSTRRD